jgi:hypothetical protein
LPPRIKAARAWILLLILVPGGRLQDLIALTHACAESHLRPVAASPCQGARLVFAAAFKEAARQDLKRTACVLVGAIASFELRAGTDVPPTP